MTTLHLIDYYLLSEEGSLWIDGELGGAEWRVDHGSHAVSVTFPKWLEKDWPISLPSGIASAGEFRPGAELPHAFGARVVRVHVDFEANVDDKDFETNVPDDRMKELSQVLDVAQHAAQATVSWLVERTRISQPQLGLGQDLPRRLGPAMAYDDRGRRLPVRPPITLSARVVIDMTGDKPQLTGEALSALGSEFGISPPTPEVLLADARYLAQWREPADPARAVLIAAIACEAKAKETLVAKASTTESRLLDRVLQEHRNFPQALEVLVDGIAKSVFDRSLREDDSEAFTGLRKLIRLRNDVAHRAETPDPGQTMVAVRAAKAVFDWLDALPDRSQPAS